MEKSTTFVNKVLQVSRFRFELGLLVDMPNPGSGTSIDGNIARRFLMDASAITSGYNIKSTVFYAYAKETAILYTELYPWYCMPASKHKLLIHGSQIIEHALLTIGRGTGSLE
ncbi:hypothetical protein PR048_019516 [Dryococelus australis]|uniref:Uncharacterized protein n=1 Tax=Dryococelus australis TaxID=614101 RepID=A0ABQ9H3N6_9NEOP|nr:hypothetical protein PR048_019516 [Dryococelus australis]